MGVFAGVEAGGTKFVVSVGSGPDDLAPPVTFPTTDPAETIGRTVETIRSLAGDDLEAVGVACFGPVDLDPGSPTYGSITSTPKPGWRGTDVVGPLRRALGVPVGFDTDVNGAALGEARWGAGAGGGDLVYVTVGTGIGGGAVVNGGLLHGLVHPEMGHLLVRRHPDDPFDGRCPYHGDCLEGLACGPAIEERWGRPGDQLDQHEHAAVAIEAWYLAQLAVTVTLVLSPHRVVLGGGVMNLAGLLEATRSETQRLLAGYVDAPTITDAIDGYLVRPGLGDRAGVLGAIALAQQAA